jgi:D-alanyl-D-alanine carboxypeptidase/D-alanyl-D-alanine-endopeptidase (penicillin-binding protein 4)
VTIALVLVTAAPSRASDAERLHYHAVTRDGAPVSSRAADEPVNPASVVKVGTSLWALGRLGAAHRYETVFGVVGDWNRATGVLDGDLVVVGGADPDFQWENAFLVARALNRAGLRTVRGRVVVRGTFWNGWEHGVEQRATEPVERNLLMGRRLIDAFDSRRWTTSHEHTWQAMCRRRGVASGIRPRVEVTGGAAEGGTGEITPVVVHQSNPLPDILRRFNVYSNNDIVRIAEPLGGAGGLAAYLRVRLAPDAAGIELATASGERRNRMTVRQMVTLVDELRDEAGEHGLGLAQLLPLIGCDDGATRRMFPALAAPPFRGAVVCKTGTLTHTDGGVAVFAGTFTGADGVGVTFAVAAPRAGGRLQHWRQLEQRWVLSLIDARGGAVTTPCTTPLPFSDTHVIVDVVDLHDSAVSDQP